MLVIVAGLPGTGKSTLAEAVALRTGGAVIDKDRIRAALFASPDIEYSPRQDDFCMELMLQTARYLLVRNPSRTVLLDGRTFSRAYQRDRVREYAAGIGQPCFIVECTCAEATARTRIARDVAAGSHPARNRTEELYTSVRGSWEPILQPSAVIDTDQPLETCVTRALNYLASPPGGAGN
jgi:predicted kinase